MANSDDGEDRAPPSRPMSAMGIEIEPDLEAPLLGTLESSKPPSRLAPLLVLLGILLFQGQILVTRAPHPPFILVVIALASMMGNLSSHTLSVSPASPQPP